MTPASTPDDTDPVGAWLRTGSRLRADYPAHHIWVDARRASPRFIAAAIRLGTHPHTVVTDNPGELRAALAAGHAGRSV
jgi:hypothetical protein